MTSQDIFTVVRESICEETQFPDVGGINAMTTANEVPGWDSLAHVRIMLGIEMELDITIPMEHTYKADTVGDLVTLVTHFTKNNSL